MYQEQLNEIRRWRAEHGERMQPPSTEEGLTLLRRRAAHDLGTDVPPAYLDFLRLTNGLDWNGLVIYAGHTAPIPDQPATAIEGFVDATLGWREFPAVSRLLFFGESGDRLYAYDPPSGSFQVRDRQSDSILETHPSFDSLIAAALEAHQL